MSLLQSNVVYGTTPTVTINITNKTATEIGLSRNMEEEMEALVQVEVAKNSASIIYTIDKNSQPIGQQPRPH